MNDYGKLQARSKVQILACVGVLAIGSILLIAAIAVLFHLLTRGFTQGKLTALIVLTLLGGALVGHVVLLLAKGGVEVYENAVVVTEIKIPYRMKKTVFLPQDIFAIIWDGPGANAINSRAMRKNTNTCEIMTDGGRTSFKLSDGYYEETLPAQLSKFQDAHGISRDLEVHKKHKY